jgi:rubrerythrin
VIFGKGMRMSDLISKQVLELWNRYKPTIAVDAIEYDRELKKLLGTNLAEVGTDCISRQAAIDAVMECYDNDELFEVYEWKLNELPPIQPKRGRWEMGIDERFVECSECGLMTTRNELRGIAVFGKNEPNFCPNCEAKMEE